MIEMLTSAFGWLRHRPAYMLLTAGEEDLAAQNAARFEGAWLELMVLSLLWGVATVGLWGLGWKVVRNYSGILFVPAVMVAVPMLLWMYRRALLALAARLGGADPAERAVFGSVIAIVITLFLLDLNRWEQDWPSYLPQALQWIWPMPLYRVLILSPLWGAWSMLITCQFRRSNDCTEPAVKAFAHGCGAIAAVFSVALPLAGTLLYFHFLGEWRLAVAGVPAVVAVAGGLVLCRNGLRRGPLLASNLLTQIAFLAAYLSNR